MIGTVTGTAEDAGKGTVIIRTEGGVGYIISTPAAVKDTILNKKTCTLFTHTAIKKDTMELFGFLDREEYSTFLLLITVSGVGPKKALATLETMPAPTLLSAIQKEDTDTLVSFGMGKKQAQRVIMDLQRKIEISGNETGCSPDVIAALVALGYDKKEIVEVLKTVNTKNTGVKEQIQEALRAMRTPRAHRQNGSV